MNFTPFPTIETEYLLLRRITLDDTNDMFEMRKDPRMYEYLDTKVDENPDETKTYISKMNQGIDEEKWIIWAIQHIQSNKVIGTICIWNLNEEEESGELGYGIVMIDINNFKGYNDTYGPDKGDQLLIEFAALLKQNASKHDLVARWGGDEFLLIVPNITKNFKSNYIANLHDEFKKIQFIGSTTIKASVGIAIYPENGETLETLINVADIEMYNSKKAMKNNLIETVLT
jgi:diguanylate cyclase (GGDEF)-like protein